MLSSGAGGGAGTCCTKQPKDAQRGKKELIGSGSTLKVLQKNQPCCRQFDLPVRSMLNVTCVPGAGLLDPDPPRGNG